MTDQHRYYDRDGSVEYGGFWRRFVALFIDGLLIAFVVSTLSVLTFGFGLIFMGIVPALLTIFCWVQWQATPGKILLGLRIEDADTGEPVDLARYILRYVGYWVSGLVFCLGYLWAAIDERHQTWHDKIARTVVVRV